MLKSYPLYIFVLKSLGLMRLKNFTSVKIFLISLAKVPEKILRCAD